MFTEELFLEWAEEEGKNYKVKNSNKSYLKKGYLHFDDRFWFPERKDEIKDILKNGLRFYNPKNERIEYHSFLPFLKIIIKTPRYRYQFEEGHYELETKKRPICFASHTDSLLIGYYSFALTKLYQDFIKEKHFDDVVLAYRTDLKKCNIQFAKEIFDEVKNQKECSTIALDIKGYFDNINHALLLEKWKSILGGKLPIDQYKLYQRLTKFSYVNQESFLRTYKKMEKTSRKNKVGLPAKLFDLVKGNTKTEKLKDLKRNSLIVTNSEKGIPQGSPISALLSNIFLIDFDLYLKNKSLKENFTYRRYCDDIMIICKTEDASTLMSFIIEKIKKEYYLTIQHSKVDLIDFRKNSKGEIRGFRRKNKSVLIKERREIKISTIPAKTSQINELAFYKSMQYLGFEFNGKDVTIRASSLSRYFRKLNYRLTRTVAMSHSPKSISNVIFRKQIYERYSHLGERNFVTYALNASKAEYETSGNKMGGMNSPKIRKQLRNHMNILHGELYLKNNKWFGHKSNLKKAVSPNYIKSFVKVKSAPS